MEVGQSYTSEEGELAVRIARDTVDSYVVKKPYKGFLIPAKFNEKSGVFVTLNTWPEQELRGCIGYPEPILPLAKALVKAAEESTRDPRFSALRKDELDHVAVEVTILTPPELVRVEKTKDYVKEVRIGIHGLIAAQGMLRGLLLPQVPVEWNWDAEEFLAQTCMKAGLTPDAWLDEDTKIYRFKGEIFAEEKPRGTVKRHLLGVPHAGP
jgi:uncharacterized protein (TIGR00296 family)